MTAPWIDGDTTGAGLATAAGCGVAFGAALERAGLGSARKLVGQFYAADFTVFQVMFTAIVVAMLGVFWLGWLGVLDVSRIYVPETWLIPQLVGGGVFGAGLALAGLCPGTSCVAAASGRGDGLAVVLGMFAGVLATGALFAPLRGLYEATPRGALTLPAWLGVPDGAVVLAVVAIALAGFAVVERIGARRTARPDAEARVETGAQIAEAP
ncbi:MAG TPA: YeeE/YedE thiosulfate transporter family protein [Kofleriaceae bacterium]|nr:YeeE/YedE thiosulfate transporter family protein [Kofleriaceae bacterium]